MDYHTGRLTITADDVARFAAFALRSIRQRRRPHAQPTNPAKQLAAAAQQELATAYELLTLNQVRAAGAVAGVALELHLKHVARTHGVDVGPYATIAQMQDTLHCVGVLTRSECRVIDKLSAIRNQCVHARAIPLRRAAVEALIQGVTRLMQASAEEPGDA